MQEWVSETIANSTLTWVKVIPCKCPQYPSSMTFEQCSTRECKDTHKKNENRKRIEMKRKMGFDCTHRMWAYERGITRLKFRAKRMAIKQIFHEPHHQLTRICFWDIKTMANDREEEMQREKTNGGTEKVERNGWQKSTSLGTHNHEIVPVAGWMAHMKCANFLTLNLRK